MTIDLSLNNTELYAGCEVEEVNGRMNLTTPVAEATSMVGSNARKIVDAVPADERDEVILTGPMAVWAYLIVFHVVVHSFAAVYYSNGRETVLIAKHG
jgi:hypothetical protein